MRRIVADALANLDVRQAGATQSLCVGLFADGAGDAGAVQIHVAPGRLGEVVDNNVGNQHPPARLEDARDFREDSAFLG